MCHNLFTLSILNDHIRGPHILVLINVYTNIFIHFQVHIYVYTLLLDIHQKWNFLALRSEVVQSLWIKLWHNINLHSKVNHKSTVYQQPWVSPSLQVLARNTANNPSRYVMILHYGFNFTFLILMMSTFSYVCCYLNRLFYESPFQSPSLSFCWSVFIFSLLK